jgi:GNAT superfamily N-acetyltransferase
VSEMDNKEHFTFFLQKNPDLSVLAEENSRIIGTALGSYDGRRGYLQKVVTAKDNRKNGIGQRLVEEVLQRLKSVGALYVPISVEKEYIHFYEKCGFSQKDAASMSIDL